MTEVTVFFGLEGFTNGPCTRTLSARNTEEMPSQMHELAVEIDPDLRAFARKGS
jgi:hypothetical protein